MTTEQTVLQPERSCDTCEHAEHSGAICSEPCYYCYEDTLSSWTPATSPRCETCIHYGAEYPDMCDVCQDTETLPDWKPVHPCFASPATKTAKAHHGFALQRLKKVCEAATPGPWIFKDGLTWLPTVSGGIEHDDSAICHGKNGRFIATARTALPALIELCESIDGLFSVIEDEPRDKQALFADIAHWHDKIKAARADLEEVCSEKY